MIVLWVYNGAMLIAEAATFVTHSSVLFPQLIYFACIFYVSFLLFEGKDRSDENYRNFLQDRVIPCRTKTLSFFRSRVLL